jgi:putative endonuclease
MATHNELGKKGEEKALEYLLQKGHVLLERNYRFGRDEADLITRHKNCVVFTEVKTRSSNAFGEPEEFVNAKKRKAMKRIAEEYLHQNKLDCDVRFDVVSVSNENGELKVYHIEDAFFNEDSDAYN